MHDVSGDDISDNSFAEGDSGQAHCNTDNDMMDGLPTASSNSVNDASRLDFSMAVQLKKSRELTDAVKYNFLTNHFVLASNFHFLAKQYGSHKRGFQHAWLSKFNGTC